MSRISKPSSLPIIMLILLFLVWNFKLRVNFTASMPKGIYRITNHMERGRLASFCLEPSDVFAKLADERGYLSPGSCPSGLRPLFKQAAALPGDTIGFQDGLVTVNGQILPDTATVTLDNLKRPLPPSRLPPGIIPAGKAFMYSPHHGSFDSRYFGLVSLSGVQWVAPVFVFK